MKRKLYSVVAAVSVGTLLIAGTFAWTNFNSSIINNFFGLGAGQGPQERTPGGTLHNDFVEGKDYRDVYIENWGEEPLIVRIQLSEYMEIGEGAGNKNGAENNHAVSIVDGASLGDVSTWTRFNGNLESGINRSADSFRYHWNWTMGGNKLYFPAPEELRATLDANGVDFVSTTSPVGSLEGIDLPTVYRRTLNSEIISMDEWLIRGMPLGNYWVVDVDGYSYWASPLAPGDATGLLLHKVELVNAPEYDYFYAINVVAHMATVDTELDNYQMLLADASSVASMLVNRVAGSIRNQGQRRSFEVIHTTDIRHDRAIDPILFQSASEMREFYHENNEWFLQSITTNGDHVFDDFLLRLSDDYFNDRAVLVVSETGSSSSSIRFNHAHVIEDSLEVSVGAFHPPNSLPDFVNRFFIVSLDRSLIRENIEVSRISGTYGTGGRVFVLANGIEHEAFRHRVSAQSPGFNVCGRRNVGEIADELTPFSFNDDFQIIIEGEFLRNEYSYHFFKLTDGEWLRELAVYNHLKFETDWRVPEDEVPIVQTAFLTNGTEASAFWEIVYWERVPTDDFLELLQPGEYILKVAGWWGDCALTAKGYQDLFRFIK